MSDEEAADLGRRALCAPHADRVLPLASIAEAHAIAGSGGGKVVVDLR